MKQEELLHAYEEIKEGIDAAPESPVPFPVVKDEKMSVIGDANETQINKHDFKIVFRLPEGVSDGEKVDGGVLKEVEYKNVFITPRQSASVISAMCKIFPYFRKIGENGDVSGYTADEVVTLLADWDDEMIDCMYNLVGKVLRIDERLIDYMMPSSVISCVGNIVRYYPEVVNEAEAFFS